MNRGHPDYMSFRPDKRQPQSADHRNDSAPVEGRQEKLQLEVVEIYKPSTHVNPIFTSVGDDPGNFYSATEATDVVFRYAENQNLVKPTDKAAVVLDAVLCDALYKGTVKKGSSYPTEIHKKDLGPTFISRMQVHHRVSRGNESAVRKGALKTVQIVTERRQGNKKVTRVSGLESFLMDAEALASELQKKFACSTSVAELPGLTIVSTFFWLKTIYTHYIFCIGLYKDLHVHIYSELICTNFYILPALYTYFVRVVNSYDA